MEKAVKIKDDVLDDQALPLIGHKRQLRKQVVNIREYESADGQSLEQFIDLEKKMNQTEKIIENLEPTNIVKHFMNLIPS